MLSSEEVTLVCEAIDVTVMGLQRLLAKPLHFAKMAERTGWTYRRTRVVVESLKQRGFVTVISKKGMHGGVHLTERGEDLWNVVQEL